MLHKPHRWANLWGGREGRVGDRWVSRATALDCTVGQYDTPLAALVAPNGYKGTRPASASVEDINHYFIGRSNMVVTAGVDVGKASLDVSIYEGPVIRFDNTVKGIGKLLKHLKAQDVTVAVCEATGGYERVLVSPAEKDRDCDARGPPEPCARVREGVWVRSQDRPTGRPGALTIRTGISGCTNTAA